MTAGETAFTSAEVMRKYRISSPMSVFRSKKALVEKDILDINAGTVSFQDPIPRFGSNAAGATAIAALKASGRI